MIFHTKINKKNRLIINFNKPRGLQYKFCIKNIIKISRETVNNSAIFFSDFLFCKNNENTLFREINQKFMTVVNIKCKYNLQNIPKILTKT